MNAVGDAKRFVPLRWVEAAHPLSEVAGLRFLV